MALPKLPFIHWRERDGALQPRFKPSQRERELGFQGCDLRHESRGPWFTFEEVRLWLYGTDGKTGQYAEIVKARKSGKPIKPSVERIVASQQRTVEALLLDWLHALRSDVSDERLADNSIISYAKDVEALIWRPETREERSARRALARASSPDGRIPETREKEPFVLKPLAVIGVPELTAHHRYLKTARGPHAARHCISAFSAAWNWGQKSTKWRLGLNPRHQIEFKQPDGRVSIISADGIKALVDVADAAGCPSVGDAVMLGLFTGQRQNDRLALQDGGLIDGRRRFNQKKTRVIVEIKETPRLAARLSEARIRVSEMMMKRGVKIRPESIVVDELTMQPFGSNAYRHRFEDVRNVAIHGWKAFETFSEARRRAEREGKAIPESTDQPWRFPPCRALAYSDEGNWDPKRDQDLRDTCVTLLYRAGCSLQEICDITGHSYQAVKTIRDHYLARDPASADAAIDKLVAYMDAKGMKL